MPTYIQVYSGSQVARLTDMTNAGKRGKSCRTITFDGETARIINRLCTTAAQRAEQAAKLAAGGGYALECTPRHELTADDFDALVAECQALKGERTDVWEREIRGIDAPKATLTAGVQGEWSASANEHGVSLRKLNDVNEWTEITPSSQSAAKAYTLAAKVWEKVKAATTFSQASDVLTAAGCQLHGYCAMD